VLLGQAGLSKTTAALQRDIARQHDIGSKVKAWVAASAMKGGSTQLKPQRLQQLYMDDALPMAVPLKPRSAARARRTNKLSAASEEHVAAEVKDVAEDTLKDVASTAEHEAALEATVKEQGEMIKKLEGLVENAMASKPKNKQPVDAKKAAPKAPAKRQRPAVPTLGSWAMAKAAGNDFGTNVVHLYDDLSTNGNSVEVKNPYASGIKEAEADRGEPDFSGNKEEDTDYWNEDEPAVSAIESNIRQNEQEEAEDKGAEAEDDGLDYKPPLASWDMAKFANNVEAGGGTMGTNIAYMYDSLSNRGQYKKVESSSPLDNDNYDEEFDEYKPKRGVRGQALKEEDGSAVAEIESNIRHNEQEEAEDKDGPSPNAAFAWSPDDAAAVKPKRARGQALKQRFGYKEEHHIGARGKKFAQGRV